VLAFAFPLILVFLAVLLILMEEHRKCNTLRAIYQALEKIKLNLGKGTAVRTQFGRGLRDKAQLVAEAFRTVDLLLGPHAGFGATAERQASRLWFAEDRVYRRLNRRIDLLASRLGARTRVRRTTRRQALSASRTLDEVRDKAECLATVTAARHSNQHRNPTLDSAG